MSEMMQNHSPDWRSERAKNHRRLRPKRGFLADTSYQRTKYPKRKRIGEVLRYFRHNRHRMRYAQAKARHLPIGSGVVEAACKSLVSQRLKCSGMRWRHDGGQAILTLRALVRSERFEPAWIMLSQTYRQEVNVPDNIVEFPHMRAA